MTRSTSSRRAATIGALASLGGLVVMLLMVVIAGAATPGYSHASQYISELGARGAPHEWAVRLAGFLPAGVLLLAFCGASYLTLPRSRATTFGVIGLAVFAAGYVVAAAFPCDPGCRPDTPSGSQIIHNAAGLAGYLLAPFFLLAFARQARVWPGAANLVTLGYVAAGLATLSVLTMSPDSPTVGVSQRLLELSVLVWTSLCGRYLASRSNQSDVRAHHRS